MQANLELIRMPISAKKVCRIAILESQFPGKSRVLRPKTNVHARSWVEPVAVHEQNTQTG
jgi:hypothetical protein